MPHLEFKFLNKVLPLCKNLTKFSMNMSQLNDSSMEGVDFSGISETVEHVDFGSNKNLNNFSFLNAIFKRTERLKVLSLEYM